MGRRGEEKLIYSDVFIAIRLMEIVKNLWVLLRKWNVHWARCFQEAALLSYHFLLIKV